jgi:hypothetical protein
MIAFLLNDRNNQPTVPKKGDLLIVYSRNEISILRKDARGEYSLTFIEYPGEKMSATYYIPIAIGVRTILKELAGLFTMGSGDLKFKKANHPRFKYAYEFV